MQFNKTWFNQNAIIVLEVDNFQGQPLHSVLQNLFMNALNCIVAREVIVCVTFILLLGGSGHPDFIKKLYSFEFINNNTVFWYNLFAQ